MHVVGHESIGQYASARIREVVGQQRKVGPPVARSKEDIFAIRTALGYVIGQSW